MASTRNLEGSTLLRTLWVVGLVLPLALAGCITRTVQRTVYDDGDLIVVLRQQRQGATDIDRGYAHPAIVSPQRLTNILMRLDVVTRESEVEERLAAVPPEVVEQVAAKLAEALGEADSSQEIAVIAIRKHRRFGVFTRKNLTSFVATVQDDELLLSFSRVEWEVPRDGKRKELPQPQIGDDVMKFKVEPGIGMRRVSTQAVAIEWRESVFAKPPVARRPGGGKVERRTVLIDSPIPREEALEPPLPEGLSADQLRALADLSDMRESGDITEGEYQRRRRLLLEGSGREGR